jgi:hypothetical protein
VERWLRATRNVIDGRAEELFETGDYRPDGPLGMLAKHLKVTPEFMFTWTREKSYCAMRYQDKWFLVVDFGHLLPLLEMSAVVQVRGPSTAVATILSREMAERFRCAGFIEEGILFARFYREHRQELARIYSDVQSLRDCAAIVELYVTAHELAHVVFGEDSVFSGQMRATVVNVVRAFVKSQIRASVDPRDPELARMPAHELAKERAGIQRQWLIAVESDEALQEELSADDLARSIVFNSRVPGGAALITTTLFLVQLSSFILKNLDVLVCGYQGGDHEKLRAADLLLRSEYAALDLVQHARMSGGLRENDTRLRLAELGGNHKELFRKGLYEHVIPQLSSLDSKRPSRQHAVPTQGTGDRGSLLDELLLD